MQVWSAAVPVNSSPAHPGDESFQHTVIEKYTARFSILFFRIITPRTPRKNNMEHNNGGLEDHVPF